MVGLDIRHVVVDVIVYLGFDQRENRISNFELIVQEGLGLLRIIADCE